MEGTIAIGRLIRRFDGLAPDGTPERGGRARFRGFSRYPISWGRRSLS
jgi:cytochrome P450